VICASDAASVLAGTLDAPHAALRAVVVIPARDEAERIRSCVRALAEQEGLSHDSYELIVVLDGCRDQTATILGDIVSSEPQLRLHTLELPAPRGVGYARRAGMDLACSRLLACDRPDGLIASTDADSVVATDWLTRQLELVRDGARAIGGRIELDPASVAAPTPAAWAERERRAAERVRALRIEAPPEDAVEHHQFSGASLSLTAEAYARCGGLPVRAALEDEALERELRSRGVPIHRSSSVKVRTSARTDGRAPRGLARDLALSDWYARRSFSAQDFTLARLLEMKSSSVGLVLPTRQVAATIGPIAACARQLLDCGLLDAALVVDAGSTDGTVDLAEQAGLVVADEGSLSSELGPARGKGDAMWRATRALESEIILFVDTDTELFGQHFLLGMLGPLLSEPDVQLVKGTFRRR